MQSRTDLLTKEDRARTYTDICTNVYGGDYCFYKPDYFKKESLLRERRYHVKLVRGIHSFYQVVSSGNRSQ